MPSSSTRMETREYGDAWLCLSSSHTSSTGAPAAGYDAPSWMPSKVHGNWGGGSACRGAHEHAWPPSATSDWTCPARSSQSNSSAHRDGLEPARTPAQMQAAATKKTRANRRAGRIIVHTWRAWQAVASGWA